MKTSVCVYILTHNRPQCILEGVESVLNQSFQNFDIVVSDNSDNDSTEAILAPIVDAHSRLKYIHHSNLNTSFEHFSHIIKSNTYEYYMLFHDDDQMMPDMVGTLYDKISSGKSLAAVATNALLRINGQYTNKKYYSYGKDLYLDREGLINSYSQTPAPYPSYMYRRSLAGKVMPCYKHGKKYCDASYLVDIANCGRICFLKKPHMYYNISSLQDSQTFDYISYMSLINYFKRIVNDKGIIIGLRIFVLYVNSTNNYRTGKMEYRRSVIKILFRYSKMNFVIKYIARLIQNHYFALWKCKKSMNL